MLMGETCITRRLVLPQASGSGKGYYLTKWYDLSDGIGSKTACSWKEEKIYYNPSGSPGKTECSGVNQSPKQKFDTAGFHVQHQSRIFWDSTTASSHMICSSDTAVSPVYLVSNTIIFMSRQHIPIWWLYNSLFILLSIHIVTLIFHCESQ